MDSNIIKIHSDNSFAKIALQSILDEIHFTPTHDSAIDIYCFCHKNIINSDIINIDITPTSNCIIIGRKNILNYFSSSENERNHLLIDIQLKAKELKEKLISLLCKPPQTSYCLRPTFTLTEKELSIMKHIAKGLPIPEIARMKKVSIKTVSTHKRNAMKKMNARTTQIMLVKYKIYHKGLMVELFSRHIN
ncbi:helix-turn-helix transcriptional regulator [Serratia fonticola]|uniref:helix-turn-helix transcriptional regulator n=1 Tax=Serratia fonticola TaxID=47917 RepID=UPI003AAFEE64